MKEYTIIHAIKDLGGINPDKIRKAGTETEWNELPKAIRSQIFRLSSTQGPDEMASQLEQFGIDGEARLLTVLKDPARIELNAHESRAYDELIAELERTRRERDAYKERLEELLGEKISTDVPKREEKSKTITRFVQFGRNFIPVRIQVVEEVPF